MSSTQIIRLSTFTYINLVPQIMGYWLVAVLPDILEHSLNVTDPQERTRVGSRFYISYFSGMIIGSLIWPTLIKYMSKRDSILYAIILQGLFNYLCGQTTSLNLIYLFRFIMGGCQNLNTVGKDFIFEFAIDIYRQYAFSLRTLMSFIGALASPFLGYLIYSSVDGDFAKCLYVISCLYLVGIVLFILVFYVFYDKKESATDNKDKKVDAEVDEEERQLVEKTREELGEDYGKEPTGLMQMITLCLKRPFLRDLVIVYALTGGVNRSIMFLLIFFLEASWDNNGFGISSMNVSFISLLSFIPASLIVIFSPKFVPSKIGYGTYIKFFILTVAISLIGIPLLRDLIPSQSSYLMILVYILQIILLTTVPKVYSPFINYYLNKLVDKNSRTALNSFTYLLSNIVAALTIWIVGIMFAWSMYSENLGQWRTIGKYFSFLIIESYLIISYRLLSHFKD